MQAINANHVHQGCTLNYAMLCECLCLIHFTNLVFIQENSPTDTLINILQEFQKFGAKSEFPQLCYILCSEQDKNFMQPLHPLHSFIR